MKEWMELRKEYGYAPSLPQDSDTSPAEIADQLENAASETEAALVEVEKHLPPPRRSDELRGIVDLLRITAALGHYFAVKDRAAVAWEVYRLTGAQEQKLAAVEHIDAALKAWERYAELMKKRRGQFLQGHLCIADQPSPWSQLDFWHNWSAAPWKLDDLTAWWRREADLIKERLETWPSEQLEAPKFGDLQTLSTKAKTLYRFDFEEDETEQYNILPGQGCDVRITRDPKLIIEGEASLMCDSRKSDNEWSMLFMTRSEAVKLQPNTTYQVAVKYRVIEGSDEWGAPFGMALRTPEGGMENEKGDFRQWGARPGRVREKILTGVLADYDDYFLFLTIHGRAAIVVDDIRIAEIERE